MVCVACQTSVWLSDCIGQLFHELSECAAISCRDRVQATRVAVALVTREGESASSDGEPSLCVLLNVDNESHRTRIARSRLCRLRVFELRFEPSAQETHCGASSTVILPRHRAPVSSAAIPNGDMEHRCKCSVERFVAFGHRYMERERLGGPHKVAIDPALRCRRLNVERQDDLVGEQPARLGEDLPLAQ